jgi:hypothetical protein
MHVVILAGGHEPAGLHAVYVNNVGGLVDLRGLGGPADDPLVTRVELDTALPDPVTHAIGRVERRQPGVDGVGVQNLFSADVVEPYIDAWKKMIAA